MPHFFLSTFLKKYKKSFRPNKRTEAERLSCYHLFSPAHCCREPPRVQAYPAAITGRPVAALPKTGSVRNSKAIFGVICSASFQQNESSLYPHHTLTLLFIVFRGLNLCFVLYSGALTLSSVFCKKIQSQLFNFITRTVISSE